MRFVTPGQLCGSIIMRQLIISKFNASSVDIVPRNALSRFSTLKCPMTRVEEWYVVENSRFQTLSGYFESSGTLPPYLLRPKSKINKL